MLVGCHYSGPRTVRACHERTTQGLSGMTGYRQQEVEVSSLLMPQLHSCIREEERPPKDRNRGCRALRALIVLRYWHPVRRTGRVGALQGARLCRKPNDFLHTKLLHYNITGSLPRRGRGSGSNHLPRSDGRASSCNDDVGSHRSVLATSSRPCRTRAAEEDAEVSYLI